MRPGPTGDAPKAKVVTQYNRGVNRTDADVATPIDTPAFEIKTVNRPARAAGPALKTVVFNARTGARFDGILACLRRPPLAGADLILLCEADWQMRRSFNRQVAADLAAALEMSFAYGPEFAIRRPPGTAYPPSFLGNAILSSVPLADAQIVPLPTIPIGRRRMRLVGQPRALIASAEFGGRQLTIALAHLDSRWNPAGRAHQIATLLEHLPRSGLAHPSDAASGIGATPSAGAPGIAGAGDFDAGARAASVTAPVILGGDFNTTTIGIET